MRTQKVFRFLLLYNILETVYRVVQAVDGRTQAFIQMDGDLRYLMDGVSVQMQEYIKAEDTSAVSFTDLDEENLNAYASPISFDPPTLDFRSHPVGMPHMEHVVVQNLSPDTSIHMLSISGNTLHFHCSFFQEKVIPPGGNTTFDVVFLARQEGPVENTLFIHTSLGSFKYQVMATGTANPYRLRPFVGVRMPLNSSYSPIIHMHNPYSSTLQLTEMYSSGGDLHLELPDGESEASQKIWEIPPYETKPVLRANFIARIEKNHTAFIRIRTNGSNEDYLILPVEVDVSSVPGIYSPTEVLDFGVLRSQDNPKVLSLSLLNSGHKHIQIVNVIVTPVNEAVDVKFIPIKVPPDTVFSTQIATITFTPSKAVHPKQCCGKIVIKSKNNQFKLQIPYQVQLLKGSLGYNKSCTKFYVGQEHKNDKADIRQLNITNNFNITIIIYSVSLSEEAKPHFMVNITHPVVLLPGRSSPTTWLTFQPSDRNLQLTTYLRLHTNISYFDIPLLCFSGRLKVFLPHAINESLIDFGTLGMGDKRTMVFAVINENPVDVNLKLWGSNATKTYVELVGVDKGNASTLAWRHNFSAMARSLVLKPQHYAIFRIGVTAPAYEGLFSGQAFVETQYEKIKVPFSLRTAKGSLTADDIFFENAFPGKISFQNLYVYSTFSHSMTVTSITPVPDDSRFNFDPLKNFPSVLHPNTRNMVGKVLFDPRKDCKQKCYSGLPTTTSMGHQWLLGMSLSPDVGDMDMELFKTLRNRWQTLVDLGVKSMNVTLRLDTTEVRGFLLKARASLQWPRLFNKCSLRFPITQIGNRTVKDFTLENPSSLPLLVQMVPLALYPNSQDIVDMLIDKLGGDFSNLKHIISDSEIFTLEDLEEFNPNPDNHIPAYRKSLEEYFGIQSHKQSIAILLTPGMRVRIQVGFSPKDDLIKSSLILIRNNLTVLDAFIVQGQGGHGQIKFGNKSPGADSVLMFELADKHLKDCDGTRSNKFVQPNFTVRRAFTARNTGALPVYIKGFDINGIPCEAYGFRILNCHGFELKPNASKKVDIAFTPDFTLSRVDRILNIHTSQGPGGQTLQYNIVATLPRHMLSFCSQTLPRPHWEPVLYYCFISLTGFLLVCVLIAAYFESERILKSTFFPLATVGLHTDKIDKGHVFDLKSISSSSGIEAQCGQKNSSYFQNEIKKKKDGTVEQGNVLSENSVSVNSKGSSGSPCSKSKETVNAKDNEESVNENSIRHSRKKVQKVRQNSDCNFQLEPELEEIKKTQSQARNSWTRFLKPSFSFRSCSESSSKPSVATQTSQEANENNLLKTLDDSDNFNEQELSSLVYCENNLKNKAKHKKETKYTESKHRSKKQNDILPEEETSSTTTETSTTESDISEKEHRLPDVCVTTKHQKLRHSKSKGRDSSTECELRSISASAEDEVVNGDGFELSTKSRGHKKIKVDPTKVFGGDILRPSTLELPYKPKPVILYQEKEEKPVPDESLIPFKGIPHSALKNKASCSLRRSTESQYRKARKLNFDKSVKPPSTGTAREMNERNSRKDSPPPFWDFPLPVCHDDTLTELAQQTENFALHQGFRNCCWQSNQSTENDQVLPVGPSTYCGYPSSYSAVLSRDISAPRNKPKINLSANCGNGKKCVDLKAPGSVRQQKSSPLLMPVNHNVLTTNISTSANTWNASTNLTSLNSPHTPEDLSGSKLARWMLQPNSESYNSSNTVPSVINKDDVPFSSGIKVMENLSEPFCPTTSTIWGSQPVTMMQALQAERRHRLEEYRKQLALYNDWPGFDLPSVGESLWDPNYNPAVDSWANDILNSSDDDISSTLINKSGMSEEVSDNLWNKSKFESDWSPAEKIWPSAPCDNCLSTVDDSSIHESPDSISFPDIGSKTHGSVREGEFDPFHTLSSLWTSQLNNSSDTTVASTGSETWNFSLFSEPSPSAHSDNSQIQEEEKNEEAKKKEKQNSPE